MAQYVFDQDVQKFLGINGQLMRTLTHPRYRFLGENEFQQLIAKDPLEANRSYWVEILARSHMAAITAIYRSNQWVEAVELTARNSNTLGFAAAMRGLIESAADTASSLMTVSVTLADNYVHIDKALKKNITEKLVFSKELEDELIHFLFARKVQKGEPAPKSHEARSVRSYLKVLERAKIDGLIDAYSDLCDLTHPGASSIMIWLDAESETDWVIRLRQDDEIIHALASRKAHLLLDLLMYAFNTPVLILAVLNHFSLQDFHTPGIRHWDLSGIKAWKRIRKKMR